jgi:aspartate kinase
MSLIVQKYGGTSVGSPERICNVARRLKQYRDDGHKLVVIVSAMSGETDRLIRLAKAVAPEPREREMDVLLATGEQTTIALLAMALHGMGLPAESFTGAQAGITTDTHHTKARIVNITPRKIHASLDEGNIVIVAGFQGQNAEGDITTLGRGGSDLSAIALAAAVKADLCQIYTDVDGVYTTDPRIEPNAKKILELSYDEMLEMASLGSKVMQSRSVEFAKKFGVVFEVRSSLNNNPGTIVKAETPSMEQVVVRGVSLEKNQARASLRALPHRPGIAARLFTTLAAAHVNVDMIVQNAGVGELANISFTLNRDELPKVKRAVEPLLADWEGAVFEAQEGYSKISVVGIGMRSHPGVAATMFEALSEASANIVMIATSEIKISVLIGEDTGTAAVKAVHERFGLSK